MIHGWDISTAIIGHAKFDDDCNFLTGSYCDLRKVEDFMEKADVADEYVGKILCGRGSGQIHFIEDKLSGMVGGSNAGTIAKLGAFNAMVSWMVHRRLDGDKLYHIHPSTVKAIMKKEGLVIPKGGDKKKLTLDFVRGRESKFPYVTNKNGNPQPYCFDQADAYITAVAGFAKYLKHAEGSISQETGKKKKKSDV